MDEDDAVTPAKGNIPFSPGKRLARLLLTCSVLCSACSSCEQEPQTPEALKNGRTRGAVQTVPDMASHISEWPPKYREKITACEPAVRAVMTALMSRNDETWLDHVAPPEFHVEALSKAAEATRTPSAHRKLAEVKRDGGKRMRKEDESYVRRGIERTGRFLDAFGLQLTPDTGKTIWPSDDPALFLYPDAKKFKSKWHAILGGNMIELRFAGECAFVRIGGWFDDRTYYLGSARPLGIVALGDNRISATTLIYPTGYSVWDEAMPIPVPPTGIAWGGPSEKGVGFLVRSSYAREDQSSVEPAHLMALHMIVADAREQIVPLTQAAYSGKLVPVDPSHPLHQKWSQRIAKEMPSLTLETLTIERWPEDTRTWDPAE